MNNDNRDHVHDDQGRANVENSEKNKELNTPIRIMFHVFEYFSKYT